MPDGVFGEHTGFWSPRSGFESWSGSGRRAMRFLERLVDWLFIFTLAHALWGIGGWVSGLGDTSHLTLISAWLTSALLLRQISARDAEEQPDHV